MKRIICLIESLVSGGAERQMVGLAIMLKKAGHDVEVWTYQPNDFYRHWLDEANVTYRFVKEAQSKSKRIPALLNQAKKWNPDVVISYLETANIVACLMKILGLRSQLIVSERVTSQFDDWRKKIRFGLYRRADWIVPNSHSQENFIARHYPRLMPKVRTITNFTDTDYFSPIQKDDLSEICSMICVGRIAPEKNILCFLDVVKRLKFDGKRIKIDWYGHKEGEYAEECLKKVRELGVEDMIAFHEAVKDIRDKYRQADVFCLPSLFEGFPNVVCEAMSCGLPVLCSRVCDNPSIVEEGVNGFLFDPTNVDEMTQVIEHFLDSSKERRIEMGLMSRKRAIEMFSMDSFIRKYLELL